MAGVVQLKDYLIRAFFALITVGIVLLIANIFNIRIEVKDYAFLVVVAIGGGWGGWYLYKNKVIKMIKAFQSNTECLLLFPPIINNEIQTANTNYPNKHIKRHRIST